MTDVSIVTCNALNPFSNCDLDTNNYWHKLQKDLWLGRGFPYKSHLWARRKREEELEASEEVVYDVFVGKQPPVEEKGSKRGIWEERSLGLWVKRSSHRALRDGATKAVTGVDVLFGQDAVDPRSNWAMSSIPLTISYGRSEPSYPFVTHRKGPAQKFDLPVPRIRKDGKFKILQASDLHLATGHGVCRDPVPATVNGKPCQADVRTMAFFERMIEEEQPDLVVLSGDQVNGETAPDAQSAIYKYAALLAKHKIPHAGIFGNHDDEGSLSRSASMAVMDGLPYSLSTAGPPDVDGVGNYYVEILGRGSNTHSALTVYLLDTHSYSPEEKKYHGYDWVKTNQIEWFKTTAQSLKKKHEGYSHIHMDMAFIHIPLPEYTNPDSQAYVGNWSEGTTAPAYNSGFADALIEENVLFVSCGHDHVNDYCLPKVDKKTKEARLWMCYGGGAGFGGYGGYNGYIRRMRVFEFDMNDARIWTWKRLEYGSKEDLEKQWDKQMIVDGGKVVTGH